MFWLTASHTYATKILLLSMIVCQNISLSMMTLFSTFVAIVDEWPCDAAHKHSFGNSSFHLSMLNYIIAFDNTCLIGTNQSLYFLFVFFHFFQVSFLLCYVYTMTTSTMFGQAGPKRHFYLAYIFVLFNLFALFSLCFILIALGVFNGLAVFWLLSLTSFRIMAQDIQYGRFHPP